MWLLKGVGMKRFVSLCLLTLLVVCSQYGLCFAQYDENLEVYKIYSDSGDLLAERQSVLVGDSILTTDFIKYKITQVDNERKVAFAEFEERVRRPGVDVSYDPSHISKKNPVICLYMTHNDESYINGDGVDSVYGAGGIHDIAKLLKISFEELGVTTYVDETLHIPHDNYAYSRSQLTAKKLINTYSPDALFDIHRDGASRNTYVKNVEGKEKCKIRIVVGKSSPNFEIAEQFAMYLLSVANEVCDWLFLDVYYASGHYNQGLSNKLLLFEMGSHLVEKDLVEQTVPELAKVVNTALFNTTIDAESGDLTINGNIDQELPTLSDNQKPLEEEIVSGNPTISEALDDVGVDNKTSKLSTITYFVVVVFGAGVIAGVVLGVIKTKPKRKKRKK